jgi:hypothetical protein
MGERRCRKVSSQAMAAEPKLLGVIQRDMMLTTA